MSGTSLDPSLRWDDGLDPSLRWDDGSAGMTVWMTAALG